MAYAYHTEVAKCESESEYGECLTESSGNRSEKETYSINCTTALIYILTAFFLVEKSGLRVSE